MDSTRFQIIQNAVEKFDNFDVDVADCFIYGRIASAYDFNTLSYTDKIKVINIAHDAYQALSPCDLDYVCDTILENIDDIVDGTISHLTIVEYVNERMGNEMNC